MRLRVRFFKKTKIGFLNPKESENGLCVSLLNRLIQDLLDHSQSGFFGSFDTPLSERSWINLFSKETQNPFSDSFGFKTPILDFFKETHPYAY